MTDLDWGLLVGQVAASLPAVALTYWLGYRDGRSVERDRTP